MIAYANEFKVWAAAVGIFICQADIQLLNDRSDDKAFTNDRTLVVSGIGKLFSAATKCTRRWDIKNVLIVAGAWNGTSSLSELRAKSDGYKTITIDLIQSGQHLGQRCNNAPFNSINSQK
jgi:hypothetical protein